MNMIDISWPISGTMTGYKNNGHVEMLWLKNFESDKVRESVVTIKSHMGTHIDAPSHFVKNGESINQLDLGSCIGNAQVLDFTHIKGGITAQDFTIYEEKQGVLLHEGIIVLLKTSNSNRSAEEPFDAEFVYLEKSGAAYLREKKIKAVGIDYLGIERNQPEHETHIILMNAGITIVEGLRLAQVAPASYFFVCLPLFYQGLEAAPARAVLIGNVNL